jgi:polysaccharide biosynthesis protein PslH
VKIFFLSSGPILPLVGGRRLREFQMLRELAEIAPVRVLCLTKSSAKSELAHPSELKDYRYPITFSFHPLDRKGVFGRFFTSFSPHFAKGFSQDLLNTLSSELKDGDLIWASRLRMARYIARFSNRKIFTVLDEHQIESDLLLDEAFQSLRNWSESINAIQVARYERALTKKAQLVVTASSIDANRVQKLSPKSRVKVIPFQLPLAPYGAIEKSPRASEKKRILFIADLEYPPNRDAIQWAHDEIIPRLKAALPTAEVPEFVVASSDPPPRDATYSVLHYDSPDGLARILSESTVGLFPLRRGRGNRIHLLEAMAMGLPVVCTGKAIDGLTVRPHLDLFLSNDADGLTSLVLRLLRDENLRATIGANARETVMRNYGDRELKEIFLGILTALGVERS